MRTAAYFGSIPAPAMTITVDRECAACGYNVRGLKVGARCPECGATIAPPSDGDDPLSRMPLRIIRIFRRAAWLATLCILLAAASIWSVMFGGFEQFSSVLAIAFLTVLWVAAMWLLTPVVAVPEAASRGFSARGVARRIARYGQMAWILVVITYFVESSLATPAKQVLTVLAAARIAGIAAGGIAMIAMAVLMERLAEWARDDTSARLFQWFQWTMPITILLLAVAGGMPIVKFVFHLGALASALLFPLAMIMLTGSITLSAVHQLEHQDRERRRADRKHQDDDALDERLKKIEGGAIDN